MLTELARYPFAVNAEIARGFLESHGIGAVVFDSGLNIVSGSAFLFPTRLMVLAEDLSEAKTLLDQADLG